MIYEDVFGRRLWKPKGAGVYLNIYRQELRCHSSAILVSQHPTAGVSD